MNLSMSAAEILREYRTAKNPKEQIKILADLNCCSVKTIVDILRGCGEKVDGRSIRYSEKKAASPPAAEPQQEAPERCENAAKTCEISAEPEPMPEKPPQCVRCMKAGTLAALLAKVDPDAPVLLDGEGYAGWIHVSVMYDVNGEQEEAEVSIHPLDE